MPQKAPGLRPPIKFTTANADTTDSFAQPMLAGCTDANPINGACRPSMGFASLFPSYE